MTGNNKRLVLQPATGGCWRNSRRCAWLIGSRQKLLPVRLYYPCKYQAPRAQPGWLLRRCFLGTTEAAAKPSIYCLRKAHSRWRSISRAAPGNNEALIADFFIEHQLRINGIYCALKFRQTLPGVSFRR